MEILLQLMDLINSIPFLSNTLFYYNSRKMKAPFCSLFLAFDLQLFSLCKAALNVLMKL